MEIWQTNPVFFVFLVGVLGLIIGSFLNVVIVRIPKMMEQEWQEEARAFLELPPEKKKTDKLNLFLPRSHCVHCKKKLSVWQNIPVLSFIFLRGKCAHCQKVISWQYPVVELLTALLSMVVAWQFGATPQGFAAIFFTYMIVVLCFIDLNTQLLPDSFTISTLWIGLLISLVPLFANPVSAILGAAAGYGLLWVTGWLFVLIRKKEGMGYGDYKMLAMLGAWLGIQSILFVLLMAVVIGLVLQVSLLIFKKINPKNPLPFGPYLAIAGWVMLVWQVPMMQFFYHLLSIPV